MFKVGVVGGEIESRSHGAIINYSSMVEGATEVGVVYAYKLPT